jgi:hypothetical protein
MSEREVSRPTHAPARRAVLAATLALSLGALAGLHAPAATAGVAFDIDVAPPAPRVMLVPPPRPGFVWAPGYWNWTGRAHAWHEGYWVPERHGYHWAPDRWVSRGRHYHFRRGHWER